MASHVHDQIGNFGIAQKGVDPPAEETDEIVQFGIGEYGKVSYLHKAQRGYTVETLSRMGVQQPVYSTSLGKTILAYLPSGRVEEVTTAMGYELETANTITSPKELFEELETIHEQGYGIGDEENINDLCYVSAPVRSDETVLDATSITGPLSRFTEGRLHGELANYI